jgi:hypothetical protein
MAEGIISQGIFLVFLPVGSIALFSFLAVSAWSDARRREREAYYRSEILKKIADTQGAGGGSALEALREQERYAVRRRREAHRLGGLVTLAIGFGLTAFLSAMGGDKPVHLVGLIPLLVGAALLAYSYLLAPKE